MGMTEKGRPLFGGFDHIGLVVKDLDRAMGYLSSLGAGPFESSPWPPIVDRMFRGKPTNVKLKVRFGPIGSLTVELIQPIEGECLAKEFADRKGEGVQHLGFVVDNLNEMVAELSKRGIEVLQSGRRTAGGGHAFVEVCGVVLEFTQRKP